MNDLSQARSQKATASALDRGGFSRIFNSVLALTLTLALLSPLHAFEQLDETRLLPRDLWPKIRSGDIIRRLEPLRRTVEAYDGHDNARILVHYSLQSAGNAWAFELKEWLVAFGIEADRILLRPGPVDEYSLALSVVK